MSGYKGELDLEWREKFKGKTLAELARMMVEMKEEIDKIAKIKSNMENEFDYLRLHVIPEMMDEQELTSLNVKGVGRLGLTQDAYVTVLAEHREEFYQWLEENGHGGMIKPYAQPGTVKAWAKDMAKRDAEGEEGCELPEHLIKVEPFYRAAVTKK